MDDLKRCFKCGKEKPRSDFYKHPQMADGLLGKCKDCTKADVAKNREENVDRIREYDRQRGKLPHRKAKKMEIKSRWLAADKRRDRCHSAVQLAVKRGVLERLPCFTCGSEKVHAHHPDYDAPLAVVWLCAVHHKAAHMAAP